MKKTDIPKAPAKIRKQEHIQELKGLGKKENIELQRERKLINIKQKNDHQLK